MLVYSHSITWCQLSEQHDLKIKPKTAQNYKSLAERFIIPAFGKVKVQDVCHKHCTALHHAMRDTPYQANRCMALLSKFFGWCEKNGYRERASNPVTGIDKYEEQKGTGKKRIMQALAKQTKRGALLSLWNLCWRHCTTPCWHFSSNKDRNTPTK